MGLETVQILDDDEYASTYHKVLYTREGDPKITGILMWRAN